MRYEVETTSRSARTTRPRSSHPRTFTSLLAPEMASLAQAQLQGAAPRTPRTPGRRPAGHLPGQRQLARWSGTAEVLRPAVIEAVPSIIVIAHNHPVGGSAHAQPGGTWLMHAGSCPKRPSCWGSSCVDHIVIGRGPLRQPQGAGPHGLSPHPAWSCLSSDRAGVAPSGFSRTRRRSPAHRLSTLTTKGDSPCSQPTP